MATAPRVAIRPSVLGCKGLALFATLELAFMATSYSNLFFLMLAFSAVLGTLGTVWSYSNLRGIAVRRVAIGMAAAGAPRATAVELFAERRRRFDLAVALPLRKQLVEIGHTPLLSNTSQLEGTLPGRERGVDFATHIRVVSYFPFGFFRAYIDIPVACELVTHPRPRAACEPTRRRHLDGDNNDSTLGRGAALAGLRPFRTGDSLSDVHWKATARRGTAVVKEHERDAGHATAVVLDRRCAPDELEGALEQLAGLVLVARHASPLQLHSQGASLTIDADRGGADAALRWLAAADALPTDAEPPPHVAHASRLPNSPGGASQ